MSVQLGVKYAAPSPTTSNNDPTPAQRAAVDNYFEPSHNSEALPNAVPFLSATDARYRYTNSPGVIHPSR